MSAVGLELDPDGVAVDLNDHTLYRLMSIDLPEPKVRPLYTGSFNTEGSLPIAENGYENREINVTLVVFAGSSSSLLDMLSVLKQKQGRINAEHDGVLRLTFPDGTAIDFDLLEAQGAEALESGYGFVQRNQVEVTLSFVAKPFWRGTEVDLGTFSETTLPCLIAVLGAIDGDVPALGRLVVTDGSAQSQAWLTWGIQSRFYDSASTAALFYQAEALTPLGGAATAVGATGASGTGSNVVRQGTLTGMPQAMLSTQMLAAAHLTHVGSFDVLARCFMPTTNTGAVSLALEWALGDYRRPTSNTPVDFDANHYRHGQYELVRLGQIHIADGTSHWEGRIVASSTVAGDDLDVDCLILVPITEGSGELSALLPVQTPTSFSARDEFDQTAGNLTGKTLPVGGGNWAATATGDATDFTLDTTNHVATRNAASDSGTTPVPGRLVYAPPVLTNTIAGVTMEAVGVEAIPTVGVITMGVVARYVDANNYFRAAIVYSGPSVSPRVELQVGAWVAGAAVFGQSVAFPLLSDTRYDVRVMALASGQWALWVVNEGALLGTPAAQGYLSDLATGGALDDGKAGIFDWYGWTGTFVRNYDNFFAYVPTLDAAIFASQSLELTHETAEREDSTGTFSVPISSVRGDYFKLAPAGREGRVNRLVVKASRNDPDGMIDNGIDDISFQVLATPRGVSIPSAA